MIIGALFTGSAFVIFNLLPGQHSVALISICIITIGEMLTMPFMNSFWISRTDQNNRGQYAGLYTVAWSTAQVVGPYAGSQVAQHYDFILLWWIVGGISVITALGFKYLQKKGTAKNT